MSRLCFSPALTVTKVKRAIKESTTEEDVEAELLKALEALGTEAAELRKDAKARIRQIQDARRVGDVPSHAFDTDLYEAIAASCKDERDRAARVHDEALAKALDTPHTESDEAIAIAIALSNLEMDQ